MESKYVKVSFELSNSDNYEFVGCVCDSGIVNTVDHTAKSNILPNTDFENIFKQIKENGTNRK